MARDTYIIRVPRIKTAEKPAPPTREERLRFLVTQALTGMAERTEQEKAHRAKRKKPFKG